MKTLKIKATIGFNEGYFHNNENKRNDIPTLIQNLCEKEFNKTKQAVSFVYTESKTIYLKQFGCPKGGEKTFTIENIANPEYVKDIKKWKSSTLNVIRELKTILKQSTVTVESYDADINYLNSKEGTNDNER